MEDDALGMGGAATVAQLARPSNVMEFRKIRAGQLVPRKGLRGRSSMLLIILTFFKSRPRNVTHQCCSAIPDLAVTALRAFVYPWCARTDSNGFNGDCSFTSYQQCQATVSGQAGECRVNPRLAFSQQGRNNSHRTF
jgi:hypothetical protein